MKTAIVLGVSGELGKAITHQLLGEDYTVIGTVLNLGDAPDFESTAITIKELELGNKDSLEEFMQYVAKEVPHVDFFTSTISTLPEMVRFTMYSQEKFEQDYYVNVLSHIELLKVLIPKMEKPSLILFILSEILFHSDSYLNASYQITKSALLGLMKSLHIELKGKGIRVNAISPAMMETKFISKIPSFLIEKTKQKSKNNSLLNPNTVAKKVIELIHNPDINGDNILVE